MENTSMTTSNFVDAAASSQSSISSLLEIPSSPRLTMHDVLEAAFEISFQLLPRIRAMDSIVLNQTGHELIAALVLAKWIVDEGLYGEGPDDISVFAHFNPSVTRLANQFVENGFFGGNNSDVIDLGEEVDGLILRQSGRDLTTAYLQTHWIVDFGALSATTPSGVTLSEAIKIALYIFDLDFKVSTARRMSDVASPPAVEDAPTSERRVVAGPEAGLVK
jgi:hypothetical protein